VKPAEIARSRVHTQGLATARFREPASVVRWLGAVQAQELELARWSVGQRMRHATAAAVDAAIDDGSILRTHVLRPTWHFVAREDLRWMLALTGAQVLTKMRPWDRQAGIDEAMVRKARKVVERLISRGGHATRPEVAAALSRAGIVHQPWLVGHLLMHAELRGVVCSGTPRGALQTYALVDERAPAANTMSIDEALATLTERYFRSHGPASARDFQWWSGLGAVQVRRGIAMAGASLECLPGADRPLLAAATPGSPPRSTGFVRAHLLQSFDEIVVAYRDTRDVADVRGVARAVDRAGLLARSVMHDGQVIARWRRQAGRRVPHIVVEPFGRLLRPVQAAVRDAVARYAAFEQREVAVEIASPVRAR
jgi:hypothetical protein